MPNSQNFSLIENLDIDCHLNFLEIEFLAAPGIVVHGYISNSSNEIYRNKKKCLIKNKKV